MLPAVVVAHPPMLVIPAVPPPPLTNRLLLLDTKLVNGELCDKAIARFAPVPLLAVAISILLYTFAVLLPAIAKATLAPDPPVIVPLIRTVLLWMVVVLPELVAT